MDTQEQMRHKFHALGKQREEIYARSAPVRARYEALRDQQCKLQEQMRPLIADLKSIEEPLFSIDQERAMLARALNGKTGEPT